MDPLTLWRTFTTTGKLILAAITVVLVAFLIWWFFIHPGNVRRQVAIEKANSAYTGAQGASAKDAVGTLSSQQSVEATRAHTTQEANDAIRHTQGASAPIDSNTNAAGLRALCMHNDYRDTPRCRKLLGSPAP